MGFFVSNSKYEQLANVNKNLTSTTELLNKKVSNLSDENEKLRQELFHLKIHYEEVKTASTIKNKKNEDLSKRNSALIRDNSRMKQLLEIEHKNLLHVRCEKISEQIKDIETFKQLLLNNVNFFSLDDFKECFETILKEKQRIEREELKKQKLIQKLIAILKQIDVSLTREKKLIRLIDSVANKSEYQVIDTIESMKNVEIGNMCIKISMKINRKTEDCSIHNFLNKALEYETNYFYALKIYRQGIESKDIYNPLNLSVFKSILHYKKILPAEKSIEDIKKDISEVI